MSNAIEVQGVSKRFRLYHEKYSSIKERVLHAGHVPYEDFWALKDIDVVVESGTTIGILGRNGSGKSTLLKCIAGILQPTDGQVVVRGQLAAMLELGAGMQPELSGRDNIYLNGSLLGLTRKEIDKRFDAIVEFAELEQFIDNQVKYYSSGMYVRLGFAVAVNVDPDILLVDEVLAVGDERFQEKCLERVYEFQREGRTIVVVGHSPDLLRRVCDSILVLDRGTLVTYAPPGEAIRTFRETLMDAGAMLGSAPEVVVPPEPSEQDAGPHRLLKIGAATIEHPGQGERPYLISGEPLTVRVEFTVAEPVVGVGFTVSIMTAQPDLLYSSTTTADGLALGVGTGVVTLSFDSIALLDGRFSLNLEARDQGGVVLDRVESIAFFEVMNPGRSTGVVALPLRVEIVPPGATANDVATALL